MYIEIKWTNPVWPQKGAAPVTEESDEEDEDDIDFDDDDLEGLFSLSLSL